MSKFIILALLVSLLAAAPAAALVGPGQPLVEVTLPDTDGKDHRLADLVKDKVALIVYWSVTCPHCRIDMPKLLSLGRSFQGNPFVLLTVNTDGKAMTPAVKAYAAQSGLPQPWLMDLGPKDSLPLADAYDLIATPAVLVLDKHGKLLLAQELKPDLAQIKKAIRSGF
ncbi:MAG: TlpA family protein disulfide reductase [Desulfarculaceae bacterium]|nr:TlpA family protein disulfide reductase [Desulfarculaceae bacterium]MCF8072725.1 TlpA family protein disulfide reductase [Desulfarculaceae bacterium]MCF8102604.1 TlpA family protein disulfide reductase [Desulfarculaceae bacterium]MCF8116513.1 TlpA family protein disulfide reductase [Desulfarculaceae bacterium]